MKTSIFFCASAFLPSFCADLLLRRPETDQQRSAMRSRNAEAQKRTKSSLSPKFFMLFFFTPIFLSALPYELNFVGLKDTAVLKSMFDVSDLVTLQDHPPASINGLRYRIASDVPELMRVLRAYGYYDATITSDVQTENDKIQVYILIHPGHQYTLTSYEVYHGNCTVPALIPNCAPLYREQEGLTGYDRARQSTIDSNEEHHSQVGKGDEEDRLGKVAAGQNASSLTARGITPERLGLKLGDPAISVNIVNAELQLLTELSRCGYPLASVEKRRVEVDMAEKVVNAAACIDEGPLSKFGPLAIHGLKTVKPRYVLRRLAWEEGQIYNPDDLETTQKRLINSDLFSSVLISHEKELDAAGELPMVMRLSEAKHQQVSLGAYYATVDGPGGLFTWTHRNLRGMGEILSIEGEFSLRYIAGMITYKKPDFLTMDQTYRALAAIEREHIHAYIAFSYRFANYVERKFSNRCNLSIGLEGAHTIVSNSASNGTYLLAGLPLFCRYNTSDDLLNPTKGYSIVYQATPFQSLFHSNQHFFKQRITTTFYIPMGTKRFIFAGRIQFGSIAGAKQENIPLPLLFLGGSEDDLRGYRYMTVSPLNEHRKPFGGRSAIFLTAETRFRFTETIGIVPFADFGTVTFSQLPQFDTKWFKSVGVGLRYFTFFGPLRADIGFPLDRRKGVDPAFRLYASIGQAF